MADKPVKPIKVEIKPMQVEVSDDVPQGSVWIEHTSGVGMFVTQRMWNKVYSKTGQYEIKKKQIIK